MMDTQLCAELRACRGRSIVEAHDGELVCSGCGKRRKTRRKNRPRSTYVTPTVTTNVAPVVDRDLDRLISHPRPVEDRPNVLTVDCTGCKRGKISQFWWDAGHRLCTRCDPLPLVAVGVHKSIPTILLAEDVTPDDVASGRRRP